MEHAVPKDGTRSSAPRLRDAVQSGAREMPIIDIKHLAERANLARDVDIGLVTMSDTMWLAKRKGSHRTLRHLQRGRQRGFTPVEEILIMAALLGCFVYPMSLAARSTGQQMAVQMESAHKTLLTQR